MILAAFVVAHLARFSGTASPDTLVVGYTPVQYWLVSAVCAALWWLLLGTSRSRDPRILGRGYLEYKRVLFSCICAAGFMAIGSYSLHTDVARGYLAIVVPLGSLALLVGRAAMRRALVAQRSRGRCLASALIVGDAAAAALVQSQIRDDAHCGLRVVGVFSTDEGRPLSADDGTLDQIAREAIGADASVVLLVGELANDSRGTQRLMWDLEQAGIEMIISSPLVGVDHARIQPRLVGRFPFQHVALPDHHGVASRLKRGFDIVAASIALVLATPVLVAVAVAVRSSGPGPVLFRQQRVGKGGRVFSILKFRTMCDGAEHLRSSLTGNDAEGPLFKLRDDPRVTPVGRILRRYSLDELPQLLNVIRGEMSLVGPRPALPSEVLEYEPHEARRLMVSPGVTGLWQVSGRSDLGWTEGVRLDLHYVENWSLILDLIVLARTVTVVIRPKGAY
ncbi:polyprenyl glycosylphosphotransferase [Leifsonia sp. LS1]|nr:polyprenyl glycosylphosphotransferase [Leifsonia sp. LS1]